MSQVGHPPVSWSSIAKADSDGIEQFRSVDSLSINHGFSLKQVLNNLSARPKYGIIDNRGEQLFYAFEESDPFQRICCTNEREFTMHVLDNNSRELITVHRELQTCSGCCWFGNCEGCMQEATIECPPGCTIGTIQQRGGSGMNYVLKDVNNAPMLFIMGPCCICNGNYSCGCENKYTLFGTDGTTEIGSIDKHYVESTTVSAANPVAFTINFPMNLDSRMKVLALAALFLIDIANYNFVRLR